MANAIHRSASINAQKEKNTPPYPVMLGPIVYRDEPPPLCFDPLLGQPKRSSSQLRFSPGDVTSLLNVKVRPRLNKGLNHCLSTNTTRQGLWHNTSRIRHHARERTRYSTRQPVCATLEPGDSTGLAARVPSAASLARSGRCRPSPPPRRRRRASAPHRPRSTCRRRAAGPASAVRPGRRRGSCQPPRGRGTP